ncbi:MAG: 50S ribosomal protein L6 [candidate division Zixibacteria bacterium]|nr:50S ribosomal protein L6 [candidate division Zixibacteria bacterium]
MSRIGKKPVVIPKGVKVKLSGHELTVEGPKGTLVKEFHPDITINVGDEKVTITRSSDLGYYRSLHGLTRALINNMVIGVTEGYTKKLEIVGIQFRAEIKGKYLFFPPKAIGYSHAVLVKPPDGVLVEYEAKKKIITVSGIDKELVGLTADKIRSIRKPEPYKGKGIKYVGEYIRRKAGKTAA